MSPIIEASNLSKTYGRNTALAGLELVLAEGRILGLVGPNGAGKTTLINSILGLTRYEGELRVLGRDPWSERDLLMRDVAFIADVAILPRWLRVSRLVDYVEGVHPRFDREKAMEFIDRTEISPSAKVARLSKGMIAQLHLAIVMAIDARLLVLDEPTLALDILVRDQFFDSLLNDYFDRDRTIVISTHQVDEVDAILTDLAFIDSGRLVLSATREELESRFVELLVTPSQLDRARALAPIHERKLFGRSVLLFENADLNLIQQLGETRPPSISDLFLAVMKQQPGRSIGDAS